MARLRVSRLRVGFQVALHLTLLAHIVAYYELGWDRIGSLDFQSFFHDFLGEGLVTAGALLALVAFGATILLGRLFCSWGCHFGAFQDSAAWVLRKLGWRPPLVRTRFLHHLPLTLLCWIFLWPAIRGWVGAELFAGIRLDLSTNAPWSTFPGWLGTVITFAACGVGILLFLGTRGFCRFVCPYGAAFRLLDPIAPHRVRRTRECAGSCADPGPDDTPPCTRACPTAVDVHAEVSSRGAVRDSDCMRCHLCIEACPENALSLGFRSLPVLPTPNPPSPPPYALTAGEEFLVAGLTILSFLAWDMTVAAHFLAATLALGEGFLALWTVRAIRRRDVGASWWALRRGGRWTAPGALVVGLFALSLVPLARGLAFQGLRWTGDRALENAVPGALAGTWSPVDSGELRLGADGALRWEASRAGGAVPPAAVTGGSLARAERAYRLALELHPRHSPTRRKYAVVLALQGSRQALRVTEELERDDPDPRSGLLRRWVERRLSSP